MTESLLGAETNETAGTTTTQGEAAAVDTQPAPDQQTTTETPPAETETATATETTEPTKTEDAEQTEGAPELYEFETPRGMPEDFEMDEKVVEALADVSRDLDLSQDNAQKLIDKVWPVIHRRAAEAQDALHEQWIEQAKADKEFGGDQFEQNKGVALKAVKELGSPGLSQLLDGPLGSHPEVFRFLWKVGQIVSEDKFVSGENAGEKSVDPNDTAAMANRWYGKGQE